MTHQTDPGEGAERDAFAVYVDLLGAEVALAGLAKLEAEVRSVLLDRQAGEGDDSSALARETHTLISTATATGFLPLARACQALQESCEPGPSHAALARTRDVALAALAEIGRLRIEWQAESERAPGPSTTTSEGMNE